MLDSLRSLRAADARKNGSARRSGDRHMPRGRLKGALSIHVPKERWRRFVVVWTAGAFGTKRKQRKVTVRRHSARKLSFGEHKEMIDPMRRPVTAGHPTGPLFVGAVGCTGLDDDFVRARCLS